MRSCGRARGGCWPRRWPLRWMLTCPGVALAAAVGAGDPVIVARRSVWPAAGVAAPARPAVGAGGWRGAASVAAGAARAGERGGDRHVTDRYGEGGEGRVRHLAGDVAERLAQRGVGGQRGEVAVVEAADEPVVCGAPSGSDLH